MDDQEADRDTQKTQPKRGKPVEIPVPTRGQVMRDLQKVNTTGNHTGPPSKPHRRVRVCKRYVHRSVKFHGHVFHPKTCWYS